MYTFNDSCLPRRHVQSFLRGCPRTCSMILERPREDVPSYSRGCHCTRSTTLEWPRGHVRSFSRGCHCTRSMILKMLLDPRWCTFDDSRALHIPVSPEVVRLCRYFVHCAGSPPPGMVICAVLSYSWRRVCLLP